MGLLTLPAAGYRARLRWYYFGKRWSFSGVPRKGLAGLECFRVLLTR
jgi:hypothetical protein